MTVIFVMHTMELLQQFSSSKRRGRLKEPPRPLPQRVFLACASKICFIVRAYIHH